VERGEGRAAVATAASARGVGAVGSRMTGDDLSLPLLLAAAARDHPLPPPLHPRLSSLDGGNPTHSSDSEVLCGRADGDGAAGRGFHSLTSQLNFSALYGVGGARRGCAAHFKGALGGVYGCVGCLCVSDTAQVELKSGRV